MRPALAVPVLADKVMRAEDPLAAFYLLADQAWQAEGAERMFLLERNALLVTELRERGVKLWRDS